jgi:hypothetical protein
MPGSARTCCVGESIGAANAAFLAADPSPEQARRLSALWRWVQPHEVFPINPLRMARALVHGTGLFPTTPLGGHPAARQHASRVQRKAVFLLTKPDLPPCRSASRCQEAKRDARSGDAATVL